VTSESTDSSLVPTTAPHPPKNVWDEYYTSDAIARTINLILRPAANTSRVIERLDFDGEIIRRNVTLELTSGPGAHIVPIAQPLRGELIDMLSIEGSDSVTSATLSRLDTAIFAKRLLELLAEGLGLDPEDQVVGVFSDVAMVSSDDSLELYTALRRAAEEIHASRAIEEIHASRVARDQLLDALGHSFFTLASSPDFGQLFRFLRRHRLLLVPCQPTSTFLKISYTYEVGSREFRRSSTRERARSMLGLSAYDLLMEVPLALNAPSYHLRMRAPLNHYVKNCVLASTNKPRMTADSVAEWARRPYQPIGTAGFVQYPNRDADGLVHVYTGDLQADSSRPRRLFVGIRFHERPFGQVGGAFIRLLIVGAMIGAMRIVGQDIVGGQSALAISIFLALPGLLGASSLINAQLGLIHAPITARIGSLIAAMFSLLASVLFLMWVARYSGCVAEGFKNCSRGPSTAVSHAIVVLLVVVALCALACFVQGLVNYFYFRLAKEAKPILLPKRIMS
jgi:hypothetical protein